MAGMAMVWDLIARDMASPTFLRTAAAADKAAVATGRATAATEKSAVAAGAGAKKMAGFAAAVGAIVAIDLGKHMVDMAGEFQQSTNILVTAAGESTKNLAMVRQGILDIASSTGTKWQNVTEGLYNIEKAGYRGADALTIMKAAAQGAREEGADLAIVTQAMTSIMASYHLDASQSVTVMNQLKTAAGEAKTSMQDFSGSLSTVLPLASANKISFADISGSLASLTQHGTSADQAAQELAFTMRGLAAPNMVAQKAMAQLGISSVDVASKLGDGPGGRGLAGTLDYLSKTVLEKMGPTGQVLLSTFNQSKVAAKDAQVMFDALPDAAKKVAQSYRDGTLTYKDFRLAAGGLAADQANLLKQWANTENGAKGFQTALKNGVSGSKTYSDEIKAMTGGANGLNTVLQLTGDSMDGTNERIKRVADAAKGAGKDVSGWESTQKLARVQGDMLKQTVQALGIQLGTKLLPIVAGVAHELNEMFQFLRRNGTVVGLVASVLGGLAAAILVVVVATKLWAAATALLNAVMDANPIVLIIIAIAALAAGLYYAYTHFEGFRKVADAVFHAVADAAQWLWHHALKPAIDAIVTAWNWLWNNAIKPAWENVGAPLFSAIGKAFIWLWNHVGPTLTALKLAWDVLWAGIKAVWNFAAPIFETIGKVVYAIIGGVVLVFLKSLKVAWTVLWEGIKFAWNYIGKPVFDAISTVVGWLWRNVLSPVFTTIKTSWGLIWDGVKMAWESVGKPVFDAIGTAISWVWTNVIKPVFDTIGAAWSVLWDGMSSAFSSIWDGVKGAIVAGINGVISIINTFITGINMILDKLPGGFKIGLITPIGTSAAAVKGTRDFGGGGKALGGQGHSSGGSFALGGVLPGYTPGRDVHQFWSATAGTLNLSGGEGILVPEAVRGLGGAGAIQSINAAYSSRVPGPGNSFAAGGMFFPQMFALVQRHFPDANLNDGFRPGASDYHGRGQAVDLGKRGLSGGDGNSYLAAMNQWIHDTYGKGTAELIYDGLGDNRPDLKHGSPMNYGAATSAQHHNHVHWALDAMSDILAGGSAAGASGSGGGIGGFFGSLARSALNAVAGPVRSTINKLPDGLVRNFTSGAFEKIVGAVASLIPSSGSGSGSGGAVGDHLALIRQALKLAGVTDSASTESALNLIVSRESGWNPNAINLTDSNARAGHPSQGLMQTIPSTFNAWRLPSLSANITDPLSNLVAGIRYAVGRYGSLLDVPGVRAVNGGGNYVGYDSGGVLMPGVTPAINLTGKPEAVLTNDEWQSLRAMAAGGGQQGGVFHLYDRDDVLLGTIAGVADGRISHRQHKSALAGVGGSTLAPH